MKTFNDLKHNDIIYKIKFSLDEDPFYIVKEVVIDYVKESWGKLLIVFVNNDFSLKICESCAKLSKDKYTEEIFECYDICTTSHSIPNGEYVYYTTSKHEIINILKQRLENDIKSLEGQKSLLNIKINRCKNILNNL